MYTGLTGSIGIVTNGYDYLPIAYISGWSIETSTEVIKTTKLGKAAEGAYTGNKSWSASADGAVVFEGADGHAAL